MTTGRLALVVLAAGLLGCSARELAGDSGEASETGEPAPFEGCGSLEVCVEVEAVIDLDAQLLCAVTASGHVLTAHSAADEYTLSRISAAGELIELAKIERDDGCGSLAHDPSGDRLWLLDGAYEGPARLRALDLAGAVELERTIELGDGWLLEHWLAVDDGELLLGGAVIANFDQSITMVLERRDADGELLWSRTEYPGVLSSPISEVRDPTLGDAGLSLLAYRYGIDSAAVALLRVDPDTGELLGSELLVDDDYDGPMLALGGDPERIYLSVAHFGSGVGDPARVEIVAKPGPGAIEWSSDLAWPEPGRIGATPTAAVGDCLLTAASTWADESGWGADQIIRHTREGGLACVSPLTELDLDRARRMVPLAGGRVALDVQAGAGPGSEDALVLLRVP